jgi:hypothetical protein
VAGLRVARELAPHEIERRHMSDLGAASHPAW